MSTLKPLKIDIVSDVVCPWCYIGKRRIENALALVPDVPVKCSGGRSSSIPGCRARASAARNISPRSSARSRPIRALPAAWSRRRAKRAWSTGPSGQAAAQHHRLPSPDPLGGTQGKAAEMKQRLMELYFRDGGDLTDVDVLVQAAADVGLDADDVRRRLATDEDVALISGAGAGGRR